MSKKNKVFILLGITCLVCFISIYIVLTKNTEVNSYKDLVEEDIKQIGDVQWENTDYYGITSDYNRSDIIQVEDGYIVISGEMWSISLVKYDFNNNVIWSNISKEFYGDMMNSDINSYVKDEKLYIFACDYVNRTDCYLYIYDLNGNLMYEDKYWLPFNNIVEVKDGFLLHNDEGILKINLKGDEVFHNGIDFIIKSEKHYYLPVQTSAIQVDDGIIYLKGYKIEGIEYKEQYIHKTYLAKFDFNGKLLWEKEIDKCFYSDISTTKDGFLAIGPDNCVKYDLNGEQIWENPKLTSITENYYAYKAIEVNEGNIIVMSNYDIGHSDPFGGIGICIVKCDFEGNLLFDDISTENVGINKNLYIKSNLDSFIIQGRDFFAEYSFKGTPIFIRIRDEGNGDSQKGFKSKEGYTIYKKYPDRLETEKYDMNGKLIANGEGKSIRSFIKTDVVHDEIYAGYDWDRWTDGVSSTLKLDYSGKILEDNIYYDKFYNKKILIGEYYFEYDSRKDKINKYDINEDLIAVLPINTSWEKTKIIADEDSLVVLNSYIDSTTNCSIAKYDLDGNKIWYVDDCGYIGSKYERCEYTGIAKVKDGYLVCCNNGLILKYNFDGIIVGQNTQEIGKFGYGYRDIATVSDGFVCVSDMGAVVKYKYDLLELTVHHFLDDTTEKVAPDNKIYGERDKEYMTYPAEFPILDEKYELLYEKYPYNFTGLFGHNEEDIFYYYKKKDANVKVLHVLEGTDVSSPETLDNVLYTTENIPGRVDDPYSTQSRLTEINRDSKIQYELVSDDVDNKTGTMELNTIYVVYEYRAIPSEVKVNHLELNTNKILSGKETVYGVVGEDYSTQDRLDEINSKLENKYELIEIPTNKSGVFTREEQEITYYYQKKESSVEVNYIDIDTNEILSDIIEMTGRVDDEYITEDMIDKINENSSKYSLIKVDGNANGQYTVDKQIITYYYKRKPTVLRVKYIDLQTGEEIIEEISVKGYVGDRYETELKQIEGYEIVMDKIPVNKDGELLGEELEIVYYYKRIQDNININDENNDNRNIFNLPNTSDINVFYNVCILVICILVAIKIKKYCK